MVQVPFLYSIIPVAAEVSLQALFAPKVDFTVGTTQYSVAIGDLDGDSKPDLTTANFNSNNISISRHTDLPLPVNLNEYNAKLQTDGTVLLTWDTFSE